MRIGIGYDVHQIDENRPLILGGVQLDAPFGLLGHSDADVILHALMDAMLGALALGDIGVHFPPTDEAYKDANSLKLLEHVVQLIDKEGYRLGNVDVMVLAEAPKLLPHVPMMRANIAKVCGADIGQVSIKATTNEKLGFIGRKEGIAAQAVALLVPIGMEK